MPLRAVLFDVVLDRVADHRGGGRLDVETLQRGQEDCRVRLGLAVGARADRGIDVEIVVPDELIEIAPRVRDEADLEPVLTELRERR